MRFGLYITLLGVLFSFVSLSSAAEVSHLATKYLIVIDKSGSNGKTDPGGITRSEAVKSFMKSKPKGTEFCIVGFKGNSSVFGPKFSGVEPYTVDMKTGKAVFTSDSRFIEDAFEKIKTRRDDGATPYLASLRIASEAIVEDQAQAEKTYHYVTLFISDGVPTDSSESQVLQVVRDLRKQIPNSVLSSASYGDKGQEAEQLLIDMSVEGGGSYVPYGVSRDWNLDLMVPLNGSSKVGTL